jgi:colanic acid/amylovoran biosynthesis glycosyltransferase
MMIHPTYSPCVIEDGVLRIDRKFHVGMCLYVERLETEIVVIAPTLDSQDQLMDFLSIPIENLPYQVQTVRCDGSYQLEAGEQDRIRALVERSDLIYGMGFETQRFARELGKPYVPIVEYNLPTQIEVVRLQVSGTLRRMVRTIKTLLKFPAEIWDLRGGHSIHCNGYPIYEQSRLIHRDCLLYLDSRMSEDMVIESARLDARIGSLSEGRRPRLLYSGRYVAMKGALDVVEVGLELFRRGVSFELDLFGKGEQAEEMRRRVEVAGALDTIRINDAIPYPELVERAHDSDLFVCCHVQDDPSCSYLEACGSGLPIAGYANRMWRHFAAAAENGVVTPMRRPAMLADAIEALLAAPSRVAELARKSRRFAIEHSFEREFAKRTEALLPHLHA